MKQLTGLVLCSVLSLSVHSQDFYAGIEGNYTSVDVGSASFNPVMATARIGTYLEPQVAIELQASSGVTDDDDMDLTTELGYLVGITSRFESPLSKEGMRVFLTLGYALTELDLDRSETGSPGSEDFDGVTYGGGFEFPFFNSQETLWNVQYQRFYSDDDVEISAFSLGLRHLF